VLVMGTENKIFGTRSVSSANKRRHFHFQCAACGVQSTLRFYCLACRFTGVTPPDCFALCLLCRALWHWWHMSAGCVQVTLQTVWLADVTYGVPARGSIWRTDIQFVLADQYGVNRTASYLFLCKALNCTRGLQHLNASADNVTYL
jgi:hypothetical protein